jgi:hypothetical protein
MANKIKCPTCNSCMSFVYVELIRYVYCSFCRTWRHGSNDNLQIVPNPNQDKIDEFSNKIEDPVFESDDTTNGRLTSDNDGT